MPFGIIRLQSYKPTRTQKAMKYLVSILLLAFSATTLDAQENWPRFRGPNGQGISRAVGVPVQWGTEDNVAWKTEIPGTGWSSPIVWDDRIFLTTATDGDTKCHIIAIDGNSGRILWDTVVFQQEPKHKHAKNSRATSTPCTDGKLVYAVFGSGGFAAVDFEGKIVWTNTTLDFYSHHGMATSPILYKDMLLLAVNPSNREEPKQLGWLEPWDKSYLLALDKATGKERWRGKRGLSRIAHATPIIVQIDGKDQILSPAGNVIQGFDPADGTLLWTIDTDGEPCVPSPILGGDLTFVAASPKDGVKAARLGGKGNCTETHLIWTQTRNVPMMSSFLYIKPCLYTTTDNGSFSCLDAATGEFLWQLRLGGSLNPSPLYVDGRIYVPSEQGTVTVLKPNADPKEPAEILAKNELDLHMLASPVPFGKQLLLRTDNYLWCVGK